MTLIVETGDGSGDSESYASVDDADEYLALRGRIAWSGLETSDKEIALRNATGYMQEMYSEAWKGDRSTTAQALDWPRINVERDNQCLPGDSIPKEIVRACCELALRASTSGLTVDETAQVKSEAVGPISVTYADGARQQVRFTAVENLLRPLLAVAGGIRIVRA